LVVKIRLNSVADSNQKRLRVLHLVGADFHATPHPLLLPMLTRGKRQHIDAHAVHFVPGAAQFAVVRQSGLPVHDVALSSKRFSLSALSELKKIVTKFSPDLIHAWGASAQPVAMMVAKYGKKSASPTPVVWSVARTTPLKAKPGLVEKMVFNLNKRYSKDCRRIVYPSAAAAAQHRRVGIADTASAVIAAGVDAARYKPDLQARQRVRLQLELPKDAILIGMYAPFQPEFDHATFIKAVGEITRLNTNVYCVMAGRAMVRGNAPLMTMVGGGTLGTRTRVIGEWSDLGALFNACDVVCSSATVDAARLMLATAMLCGVLCVGTAVGAQGEVIGNFGAAVEPGSPEALVRGLRRIIEMPPERKSFMMREARKHILQNFNLTRAIERYYELYFEIATGAVPEDIVTPITLDLDMPFVTPPAVVAPAPIPTPAVSSPPVKQQDVSNVVTKDVAVQRPAAVTTPHVVSEITAQAVKAESVATMTTEKTITEKPVTEKPIAPVDATPPSATPRHRIDHQPVSLDSALALDLDVAPVTKKVEHAVVDNVMEWSEAESELISAVIIKDEATTSAAAVKPAQSIPDKKAAEKENKIPDAKATDKKAADSAVADKDAAA
jgi:glycosyltransferase involved in cell wall biosynthesis